VCDTHDEAARRRAFARRLQLHRILNGRQRLVVRPTVLGGGPRAVTRTTRRCNYQPVRNIRFSIRTSLRIRRIFCDRRDERVVVCYRSARRRVAASDDSHAAAILYTCQGLTMAAASQPLPAAR